MPCGPRRSRTEWRPSTARRSPTYSMTRATSSMWSRCLSCARSTGTCRMPPIAATAPPTSSATSSSSGCKAARQESPTPLPPPPAPPDLAPLDLRHPQQLADPVVLHAGAEAAQREAPAAHVEGQVLFQSGQVPQLFQKILEAPRRPREQLRRRRVLAAVLFEGRHPGGLERQLAFLVALACVGVANVKKRALDPAQLDVVQVDPQAFTFLGTGVHQQMRQGEWARVGGVTASPQS